MTTPGITTSRQPFGLPLIVVMLVPLASSPALGQFRDGFESPEVGWTLADSDSDLQILQQARTTRQKHSDQSCEYLQLSARSGTYGYLTYAISPAQVIEELHPSLWILADRPGLQLMARVVFPASRDPSTGQPLTALLRGDLYRDMGSWQRLTIGDVQQQTQRQLRVLRSQFGAEVSQRGAYVDLIVLNGYAGPGVTHLWTDDLLITGFVPLPGPVTPTVAPQDRGQSSVPPSTFEQDGNDSLDVRLQGSILMVGQRPFFPRAIQYQGENFSTLKGLGFNAIVLSAPATEQQTLEAERLDLWLICPPPQTIGRRPKAETSRRVLTWYLGDQLPEEALKGTEQLAGELGRADSSVARPLLGGAAQRFWAFSRALDVLLVDLPSPGNGFEWSALPNWLRGRFQLARPGTPHWVRIAAEPDPQSTRQLAAFGAHGDVTIEPQQLRLLCYWAVAAGARGICFQSSSRLDAPDPPSQMRAAILQLVNLELALLHPWAAAGTDAGQVETGLPDTQLSALQTERARLLIVTHQAAGQQFVTAPTASDSLSLVIPNTFSAPQAFQVTWAGLSPLRSRRVAGGIRVDLEQRSPADLILLSQDPLVINHVTRQLSDQRLEAQRLQQAIDRYCLRQVSDVHLQLRESSPAGPQADQWLQEAQGALQQSEQLSLRRDERSAGKLRREAERLLARVRRAYWVDATRGFPSPGSSPFCVQFGALPYHWEMVQAMRGARFTGNVLIGGDMESLNELTRGGWINHQHPESDVTTLVELSEGEAKSGQSALRLTALPTSQRLESALVESPPIQVVSGPVAVRRGQIVRIEGWVRTTEAIQASYDGLLIYDSLGGKSLAHRVPYAAQWQPFVLYRAAPDNGQVQIYFELAGLGTAWIDQVAITVHDPEIEGGTVLH